MGLKIAAEFATKSLAKAQQEAAKARAAQAQAAAAQLLQHQTLLGFQPGVRMIQPLQQPQLYPGVPSLNQFTSGMPSVPGLVVGPGGHLVSLPKPNPLAGLIVAPGQVSS